MIPIFLSYVNDMETKDQNTIDISRLTRFQKKQMFSLFERLSSENKETTAKSFTACPKCGESHAYITRSGRTKGGKQLYLCHECRSRFVEDIGRPSYYSRYDISAWKMFIEDTLEGKTLDESAEKLGIQHSTAWSWRHKIMEMLSSFQNEIVLSDKSELDEKYFHKSHKGKEIEGMEPKGRGTPASKRGISDDLICSLTGVSRDGGAFAEVHNMGKPSQDDVDNISCHFKDGTFFWIDGTNCYDRLIREKNGSSIKLKTWKEYNEKDHLNNVNSLHSKMEERMLRCHGVADKYLPRYCALWAKVHSLSGLDMFDKVRSILGLYAPNSKKKRPKTTELQTLNIFTGAAS